MVVPTNVPAIRCQGLTRHYGDVQALNDLDLEILPGEVFGFLGRNGAGKTTTIRLLTGLARPTAGSAWVAGVETTGGETVARRVFGYLPQAPAFYKWMTAREYLDYCGQLFGMDPAQRKKRITQVLELVDLRDAARRRIGGFSGGMVQRLGIAQAFLHEPAVLFLDEPTSSLDPAGRYEVLELMDRLRGEVTIFFSTHILSDIERVCDTIAIIHQGRLVITAGRSELLSRYPVNTLVIELDKPFSVDPTAFRNAAQALPFVTGVNQENSELRVVVSDLSVAKTALPGLVAAHGLAPLRYEWVRPSLEEIFLQISGGKAQG